MTRPGAGLQGSRRRIVRSERAFGRVEAIDQHFVQPEVRRHGESIGRVQIDGVRVGPILPLLVVTLEPVVCLMNAVGAPSQSSS